VGLPVEWYPNQAGIRLGSHNLRQLVVDFAPMELRWDPAQIRAEPLLHGDKPNSEQLSRRLRWSGT